MGLISELANQINISTIVLVATVVYLLSLYLAPAAANEPPVVPYSIPFLGSAIQYGIDPVAFLQRCQSQLGDCFTFIMMGRKMTFCLNPDGNHFVFNVPLAHASAEVVYDVDNALFMEQKKFVKDTFSITAFKKYISLIRHETIEFFATYKQKGETILFNDMSELTIRTASCCLMGKEIRSQLHSNVAKLYHDLDSGLAPINVFFKWLPLPAFFARDKANASLTETFKGIIKQRRMNKDSENEDVLQTLMTSTYKDGSKMSDNAIAHLMIATLMGGQHTSSTTTSWILFEISRRPDIIAEIIKEQSMILTGKPDTAIKDLPDFDYDQLKSMVYLENVMKETLRLHPPIHTVMRKVEKTIQFKEFVIPPGHFLCGSQAFSQLDPVRFPDPTKFEPKRFNNNTDGTEEWSLSAVNIAQKSAKSHFLPFGAGRHRCIGEAFAYIQIKSIVALFVREFEFKLTNQDSFPKMDYSSLVVVPEKDTYLSYARRQ